MRVTFFRVAERKSPKKGRPYCARPFAALRATCDARTGGAPQNSLRATRSVQTTAASQCTKCVCPSALARRPCPALLGTRRREPQTDIHTGHCFASLRSAPTRGRKRHALRRPGQAQRWPEWLFGCLDVRLSTPCWLRLRRGGCGVSTRVEARVLRELTRRGCLNEAATQRSEFHGAPRKRPDAGLPLRAAKGSQTGGRLFFGDFLLAKQKKVTRTPGDSRPPPSTKARTTTSARPRQAQPERLEKQPNYKNNSYQRLIHKRQSQKTPKPTLTPAQSPQDKPASPLDQKPSAYAQPPPPTGCPPPATSPCPPEKRCCRSSNTSR